MTGMRYGIAQDSTSRIRELDCGLKWPSPHRRLPELEVHSDEDDDGDGDGDGDGSGLDLISAFQGLGVDENRIQPIITRPQWQEFHEKKWAIQTHYDEEIGDLQPRVDRIQITADEILDEAESLIWFVGGMCCQNRVLVGTVG